MWGAVGHFFGLDNAAGAPYLWWSGMGSDLSEVAIIGAVIGLFTRHNCHVKGCWRLGTRPVGGTTHVVCSRHHPQPKPSAQKVLDDHREGKVSES
ncbi:MAG: hypothetical protein ACRENL_05275 [Candidatus Dormibacteria bacterium]